MQSSSKSPNPSPDPDIDDASSKRQATRCVNCSFFPTLPLNLSPLCHSNRVFKKSSANGKITVYLGKRDFVDHITHVDPIGEF
jgi:beta-arrestin